MKRLAVVVAAASLTALAVWPVSAPATANVPDQGRAWELVTPAEPVGPSVVRTQAINADGTRVVYVSSGPMPGAPAGSMEASNLAIRGNGSWSGSPLGAPYSTTAFSTAGLLAELAVAFDANLSTSIWTGAEPLVPGGPVEGHVGLYRIELDGTVTLLADMGEPGSFIAASEDTQHVVFSSSAHLLAGDAGRTNGSSIYEINGSMEQLVDVDTNEALLSSCGSIVNPSGGVSRSGSRIFFTNPALSSGSCPQPSHVYLREGGDTTTDVSVSQCDRPDCNSSENVSFAGATPSGSSVFLTSAQQLTNADLDERPDLYRYDIASETLTLISGGSPEADGEVVSKIVHTSADGSHVYFNAKRRLLSGLGSASGENLYLADEDGLHFIAPTGSGDPLQISQDGRIALLETIAPLDVADTDGRKDVYLYSVDTGTFTWLSEGVSSGNGDFDARITSPVESQVVLGGSGSTYRALTEDGGRAFFSTAEKLIPSDHNEATDVYEWTKGELGLISAGDGADGADFAGVSAGGQAVLFKTSASLLSSDRDGGERDLYAARIGGFAVKQVQQPTCGAGNCATARRQRIVRPIPASIKSPRSGKRGRLKLLQIDPDAGESVAADGQLQLQVRVPAPGLVSGLASMRVGGRSPTAAAGSAGAIRAGTLTVVLQATQSARLRLRRRHVLRLRLVLHQSHLRLTRKLTLRLNGAR
jgi:hypothetical protein